MVLFEGLPSQIAAELSTIHFVGDGQLEVAASLQLVSVLEERQCVERGHSNWVDDEHNESVHRHDRVPGRVAIDREVCGKEPRLVLTEAVKRDAEEKVEDLEGRSRVHEEDYARDANGGLLSAKALADQGSIPCCITEEEREVGACLCKEGRERGLLLSLLLSTASARPANAVEKENYRKGPCRHHD